MHVSIRARHCWRANRGLGLVWRASANVSIRARHCWRANPSHTVSTPTMSRFNPRPPLLAGESTTGSAATLTTPRFNPRPPLLAGESLRKADPSVAAVSFNPRPPLLAGESRGERGLMRDSVFQSAPAIAGGRIAALDCINQPMADVSIRARHCWRANPGDAQSGAAGISGFNPRPPLLAGESQRRGHEGHLVAFQSAPAIAGGRIALREYARTVSPKFQSAPAIAGGRISTAVACMSVALMFQSAPAIAGGRIYGVGVVRNGAPVSIRARHCWRANPVRIRINFELLQFQSAPAIAGGRIPARCNCAPARKWFQSAPAIAGGRISIAVRGTPTVSSFQSAPAIAGGRIAYLS